MKIWLRLHGFQPCSWTYVWENLRDAFLSLGDEVCDLAQPVEPEEYIELWWGDPQFWHWSDLPVKARVALALSEARSILADGKQLVISNLAASDLVICPSEAATTAFREAPIESPIAVVWFGSSPRLYPVTEREWFSEPITFLHAGVTQFRKGSWLAVEGFLKAFSDRDRARLLIASPRSSPMHTRLKSEFKNHPKIEFSSNRLETSQELYERSHIYVSPHLSEGFGLMIPEAMSTGMPCLVSRCSAPREYFSSAYGWWVEMSDHYVPVAQCLPKTEGFWRLPSVDSLARVMREAYEDRQESQTKGKAGSEYVRHGLTWEHTAMGIKEAIKQHLTVKESYSEKGVGHNVRV